MPVIRDAGPADHAVWLDLWQGYLAFLHTDLRAEVTANVWHGITEPTPRYRCRLAQVGGEVSGFAIHHPHLSTWSIRPDCYLEDLFVAESARGMGLGRALIDDLVAICREKGWERLYWMTEATNVRAQALYNSYCETDGNIRYRFRV
jgi:GNAT superfamily N-acetyltransferase